MLETPRLRIRPFRLGDAAAVIHGLCNFEVSRWLEHVPHPYEREDFPIYSDVDGLQKWPEFAAICLGTEVIGGIGVSDHLGYWLAEPHWGQGFATEAARVMIRHHFNTTESASLASGYFIGNDASARVLEKCGFRETERGLSYSRSNRCQMPHVWMELTRDAWSEDSV